MPTLTKRVKPQASLRQLVLIQKIRIARLEKMIEEALATNQLRRERITKLSGNS